MGRFFPKASSFFVIYFLLCFQLQVKLISCSKVILYADSDHKGFSETLDISQCANLTTSISGMVSSVNSRHGCVRLYNETNCGGNFIEILSLSPSHNDLTDWNFNDKTFSAGPCADICSTNTTRNSSDDAISVRVFDRTHYRGASELLKIDGCTIVPRKFNYRILSVNTTSLNECIELFDNVYCSLNSDSSIELRRGTPFHYDIYKWKIHHVKAISRCTFKCQKTTKFFESPTNSVEPKADNEVILFDEPDYKGNFISIKVTEKACVNLNEFTGWEGAAESIKLYGNKSCVILHNALNCLGSETVRLNSSLDYLSIKAFYSMTRSFQFCGELKSETELELESPSTKGMWLIFLTIVGCLALTAVIIVYVCRRWYASKVIIVKDDSASPSNKLENLKTFICCNFS